jgi:hypothetical protein
MMTTDKLPDKFKPGPVGAYACPYGDGGRQCLKLIFEDWGVQDHYLVNPAPGGKPPEVSRDGGPKYMLRLSHDGRWHYASFQGLNGPPWTHIDDEGVEAPTGEIAWLRLRVENQRRQVESTQNELVNHQAVLADLETILDQKLEEAKGGRK